MLGLLIVFGNTTVVAHIAVGAFLGLNGLLYYLGELWARHYFWITISPWNWHQISFVGKEAVFKLCFSGRWALNAY
jgi:uncharacterized membrane protein HdeD (DUF308 family)